MVLLVAGCATSPRRTGVRVPDWESPDTVQTPSPAPPAPPTQPKIPTQPDQTAPTWIPLAGWCKANGLVAPSRLAATPAPAYGLATSKGGLVLHMGSRLAYLAGTQVWLGFGPQVVGGQPCVHVLDLKKTLEPLINGAPSESLANPPTIVIDPGHGGEDAGTRSVWGNLCEKDLALDWARRLKTLLST